MPHGSYTRVENDEKLTLTTDTVFLGAQRWSWGYDYQLSLIDHLWFTKVKLRLRLPAQTHDRPPLIYKGLLRYWRWTISLFPLFAPLNVQKGRPSSIKLHVYLVVHFQWEYWGALSLFCQQGTQAGYYARTVRNNHESLFLCTNHLSNLVSITEYIDSRYAKWPFLNWNYYARIVQNNNESYFF